LIALDTNILIYAITDDESDERHQKACDLLEQIAHLQAIVPLQVVGEFLNVCKKRKRSSYTSALERADRILRMYNCIASSPPDYLRAAIMSHRYKIQYFDALILTVAARAGATVLLSEDMQDGLETSGLRVVNPFVAGNDGVIAGALRGS
jgi:predicted nucleic acid-binding protein